MRSLWTGHFSSTKNSIFDGFFGVFRNFFDCFSVKKKFFGRKSDLCNCCYSAVG